MQRDDIDDDDAAAAASASAVGDDDANTGKKQQILFVYQYSLERINRIQKRIVANASGDA